MRHSTGTIAALAVVLLATAAGRASAQIAAWDSPSYLSPGSHDDLGVYYTEQTGTDWGVTGLWRSAGNIKLALRLGYVRGNEFRPGERDNTAILGVDFGKQLARTTGQMPIVVEWNIGAGASLGDISYLRIPAGVIVGMPFGDRDFLITPYAYPRAVFGLFSNDDNDTETEFRFAADLGADFDLGGFVLRFGYTFDDFGDNGDFGAWGIGAAIKTGRRTIVR